MSGHRAVQVGAQIREEIMQIIHRDLKDPRIGFVSITEVRMSPDLRSAKIRVSVLGGEAEERASIAGLRSASGLIRHELGRRLENLKFTPNCGSRSIRRSNTRYGSLSVCVRFSLKKMRARSPSL